jgi:dTDP-4-dehydrorhamnose reductase
MMEQRELGDAFAGFGGTYHYSARGKTSWFGFATEIIRLAELASSPVITPVRTEEFPRPAKRPAYSVLDCTDTERTFGVTIPHWADALQEAFASERILRPADVHQRAGGVA